MDHSSINQIKNNTPASITRNGLIPIAINDSLLQVYPDILTCSFFSRKIRKVNVISQT